jgi:hypothetical protein
MRYWHWSMVLLLSLGLAACGSGASGFGPQPGGGSGTKATTRVTVFDTLTNPQPLSNVQVFGEGETSPTLTGPDGRATVTVPTGQASRLVLQFSEGSQTIYPLTVPAGQQTVEATLFTDPIAATSTTPGVMIMPTVQAPAGTAEILDPPDGATITCAPPPAVCRFDVHGQASTVLGQPGTPFLVYVAVTPLSPSGGGTFPQFPPVSVDPVTGLWQGEAHIGGAGIAEAHLGDTFQIVALVTSALLTEGTTMHPLLFPSPGDIPGVVYISRVINLQVGQRRAQSEAAVLLDPPDSDCTNVTVTFQWRIDNRRPGVTYCSDLLTDTGLDPFDSRVDHRFHAGQATALRLSFDPQLYDPALFQWGIRVMTCNTIGAACEDRDPPCQGQVLQSDVRRLRTSARAPHCP